MVAIARESLNISDASGSIADPLVWDRGSKPKARRIGDRVVVWPNFPVHLVSLTMIGTR